MTWCTRRLFALAYVNSKHLFVLFSHQKLFQIHQWNEPLLIRRIWLKVTKNIPERLRFRRVVFNRRARLPSNRKWFVVVVIFFVWATTSFNLYHSGVTFLGKGSIWTAGLTKQYIFFEMSQLPNTCIYARLFKVTYVIAHLRKSETSVGGGGEETMIWTSHSISSFPCCQGVSNKNSTSVNLLQSPTLLGSQQYSVEERLMFPGWNT